MQFKYQKSFLPNGIRVVSVPLKSTSAVTALILVGTGSFYEPENTSGISHFLEHLFFKGSKKYPSAHKISSMLDGVGAEYNAFTAEEVTGFYVKVVKEKLPLALDVMSDFLKNPLFVEKEISRERGVILEELRMYYDTPQRHVLDLLREALYGKQAAGRSIGGSEKSVPDIKSRQIKEYFKKQYRGDNIVAVFGGNISQQVAVKLSKKFLSGLPSGNSYDKEPVLHNITTERVVVQTKSSDQTHLALGFSGTNLKDDRRYPLSVLSVIMGGGMSSRLFSAVREKRGLAYYVRCGLDMGTDFGDVVTTAGVTNSKLDEALKVIIQEFKTIKKELIDNTELQKAKNHIEGSMLLNLETSDAVASEAGIQEVLLQKIVSPAVHLQRIKKVSPADIQHVANEFLISNKVALAIVGPHKNKSKLEDIILKV